MSSAGPRCREVGTLQRWKSRNWSRQTFATGFAGFGKLLGAIGGATRQWAPSHIRARVRRPQAMQPEFSRGASSIASAQENSLNMAIYVNRNTTLQSIGEVHL